MEAAFPVILVVDQDSTTRRFIESTDNVNERALAAASGADNRNGLPLINGQVNVP